MLTDIMEVDARTYKRLIKSTINNGGNLIIFGQKGIGKTEIAMEITKEMGYTGLYWNLSTQEAPDLIGLATIKMVNGIARVEYASPEHIPVEELYDKKVVVLVDELDKAKEELQNPMLEVFQFRSLNGRKLNIQAIIATGNLPDEHAFSKVISHALTNRSSVFKLRTDYTGWRDDYAVKNGINPLIVGFLSKNPEYLCRTIPDDMTAYATPSPRSWSSCSKEIDSHPFDNKDNFITTLMAGHVGSQAAIAFKVWIDYYKDIEKYLDQILGKSTSKKKLNLNKLSMDKLYILAISSCAEIARKIGKIPKNSKELLEITKNVFSFIGTLPMEMQIAATKSTLTTDMIINNNLDSINEVMNVFRNINKGIESDD